MREMKHSDKMIDSNSDINRAQLGFTDATLQSFNFLVELYAFRCVKIETTFVRYESSKVFVNIYHGRRSYTLGVEIGYLSVLPDMDEVYYTLHEILSASDENTLGITSSFQANTPEGVENFVLKLAEIVKNCTVLALNGDPNIYQRLRENRHVGFQKYQIDQVKIRAEAAWIKKDYKKAIELYGSLIGNLSPAEAKKLDYARKNLPI